MANTIQTRGVLAGAYSAKNPKSMLTHALEIDADGRSVRVLCSKRVNVDNLCDEYAYSAEELAEAPTCPGCLAKWTALRA